MNNIVELFPIQKPLDKEILENYTTRVNRVNDNDIYNNKVLALSVEIGELANETKCFKFWSKKQNKVTEKALEEYVDCLHFILSIGNANNYGNYVTFDFKYCADKLSYRTKLEYRRTDHFLSIITAIQKFYRSKNIPNYQDIIDDFIIIGLDLGFTEQQIINAYLEKNKENYKRQESNY